MNYDYNSSRKRLSLPEYGRNIQKMVDHMLAVEDREKRTRMANAIIAVMGNLNPHLRDIADFKHKLWDHLAIMSDFKLDIDSPYPIPERTKLYSPPRIMKYPHAPIRYKHYGKSIERLIKTAMEMEDGEKKQALIEVVANNMKKQYLVWNKDVVSDEKIFDDLKELSKGAISLTANDFKLAEVKEPNTNVQHKPRKKRNQRKK
jgi:hypothetical protein